MADLKEKEQKILDFMREEIRTKGYPPTVREICAAVGIKSTSTAHKAIGALVEKGYLRKDPAKPRALVLVPQEEDEPETDTPVSPENAAPQQTPDPAPEREDIIDIPVIGRVAAGTPITAEENMDGTFPVPAQFVQGTCFMLRVRGESMIKIGRASCRERVSSPV